MVFVKPLSEISFDDISALQQNKMHESDVLDYKIGLLNDDLLIKHVTAFANTRGGFIVFGVEETGKGGFPKDIPGIDCKEINKERMEQILLSNISPRLGVKIREIPHSASGRSILIVQIPDSYLKPHMNLRMKKYYKRYEFEALEMEEREVSDAYRRRLITYEQTNNYLKGVLSKQYVHCEVLAQIVVIPTVVDTRLIDTTDRRELAWLDPNKINPQPVGLSRSFAYVPSFPEPSPTGIVCQQQNPDFLTPYLELHRNGCVEYGEDLGFSEVEGRRGWWYFPYVPFCLNLLHTLQFASMVYSRYNYFGDVRIVVSIRPSDKLMLPAPLRMDEVASESSSIVVQREFILKHTLTLQQEFMALNGGPQFTFSRAISFLVNCEIQEEVDELWEKLSEGGEEGPCGWLRDQNGVSWQIVPTVLGEMLQDKDAKKSERVLKAMLQMKKIDIRTLKQAYEQR
jgi:predicted 3-demethylubiquinone-9 3-methyltransferase (glyoxalase superfamily)